MARTLGLQGIDISQHQGAAVLSDTSGLSFVVLRATIGTIVDTDFELFYPRARAAGLVVMAYHYGYPADTVSVEAQVSKFLSIAAQTDFLWLDQEQSGFNDAQAQKFVDLVHAAGRKIGLYHSASGFGGVLADARWVADYRAASVTAGYPRSTQTGGELQWDMWQWSSTGSRPGYTGNVDLDWLNPTSPLAALLRKGYVTQAQLDTANDVIAALTSDLGQAVDKADALQVGLTEALTSGTAKDVLVSTLQAQVDRLQVELADAVVAERERIAAAEAARIRAI